MKKRAHLLIFGEVTGVGFRSWTVRNARNLGLAGWVRNVRAGLVEAVFEGEEEKVKKMVDLCHQGPLTAWVEKVRVAWEEVKGEENFSLRF